MIDWKLVRRIAGSLSGEAPGVTFPATGLAPLARDAEERIVAYTGLEPRGALPQPELVSRRGWIDANIETMRPVFNELAERLPERGLAAGPLGPLASHASSVVLSAQVGAMTGYLAQRVLGQYDIPLLNSAGTPRLLLV
ncbi:MAG TPA: zinc-dependent metalloprotease, partial [Solirubrobacteraceae bacterium]|nr:zinc-dependent metalloprotease [Solirubrobacteraceae bacterium]